MRVAVRRGSGSNVLMTAAPDLRYYGYMVMKPGQRLRPAVVPASLDDLRGPATGVVELPVRLYWSAGSGRFDLSDPDQVAAMCDAVLDAAANVEDITTFLNAQLLVSAWPVLGMDRVKREAWESRFPVLRRRRLAAAA